ncbi:ABC transporter ATP-binding protein [Candidatus Pacearchaeota archaeon]|nr:ABC transporter ATP-binding protein [Candidatus Pacearchaeota archaeon]
MKIEKNIDFKYNVKEYFSILKRYKLLLFSAIFVILVIEVLMIVDKFLFKIIIDNGTKFIDGTISQAVFTKILIISGLIFLAVIIARPIMAWIKLHLINLLESNLILDLKEKYFNHIIGLSYSFHTTHKTGSLISRLNRGAHSIETMTDTLLFNFSPLIFQIIVVGASLSFFNWILTIVLIGTSGAFILYSFAMQHLQQKVGLYVNSLEDRDKGFISDVFANMEAVKYFGKEFAIKNKFLKRINKTKDANIWYGKYYRWLDAGQIFILGIGTLLMIYFPLMDFLNKEITLGSLAFVYSVIGNVFVPMFGFVWGMRQFYRAMSDFQDLFEYGKIESEIKDRPHAENLEIKQGIIEFKNISFHYGKRKAFSLEDFNLKINKNEKIALVGHSGCGKTSLIKLLYRLYDVETGEILIDEKDIRDFKQESLRGELSIVPQECILFDDTIFNNIKFSNPDATREEVFKAIRFAQLDKLISRLPKKENTIVGERGIKLSGGERQRVSIARAILANKKILVLDEATSSLDSETENEIQKNMQKLLEGRTSIIIAHRLSTIMNADRIIVMKDGKIIQEGNHRKLISREGEYRKLWNLQKGGYIKE